VILRVCAKRRLVITPNAWSRDRNKSWFWLNFRVTISRQNHATSASDFSWIANGELSIDPAFSLKGNYEFLKSNLPA
jgi:hypothetical protein